MAQVEKYFDSVGAAFSTIIQSAEDGGIDAKSLAEIKRVFHEISAQLPAVDGAIKLLYDEPGLIEEPHELAFTCGKLAEKASRLHTICAFGIWPAVDVNTSSARLEITKATSYLLWVLPHARSRICRNVGFRKKRLK